MIPERWKRIEQLYHEARARTPGERARFLAAACADDDTLRREVETLLEESVSAEGFLDQPALARAAEAMTMAPVEAIAGRSMGVYRLQSLLGVGGMGEVYRAHDAKLGRDVAIKILPRGVTRDPDRLARFEREARMLAALNHPNICAIYGLEEADGVKFLILELVEGRTLADALTEVSPSKTDAHGLPLITALTIARQIAEALEVAHRKGIIHRDLKPANIKITADGVVKVLDFGLAKTAVDEDPGLDRAPSSTGHETQEGLVLGTPAYMSPEQAGGKAIDTRTDIWAFGCVLHEMLAGQAAFGGSSAVETIAKILEREPDWSALPGTVPESVRRLLLGCLAKDPNARPREIGGVKTAIDAAIAVASASGRSAAPWRWLPWAAAGALAAGLAGTAVWGLRPSAPSPVVRFPLSLPAGQRLEQSGGAHMIALSPDGERMAYVATPFRLYLRRMSDVEMTPIPGTEKYVGVREPVFSPDGLSIAFFAFNDSTLKIMAVTGGAPVTICRIDTPAGMNWGPTGIVYGQGAKGVWRVTPSADNTPQRLASVAGGESAHGPQILPDGEHVLFTVAKGALRDRWDKAQIVVESLRTHERKALFTGSDARYVATTGHLVYAVSGRLYAVPFDAQRLETAGSPVEIVSGVNRAAGAFTGTADFSVSTAGTGSLVYVPGPAEAPISAPYDIALLDRRDGKDPEPLGLPAGFYSVPRVSPDGSHIAFTDDNADGIVWTRAMHSASAPQRLTLEGSNHFPIWTRDSKRIVYQSSRDGRLGIFWQAADGSDRATPLTTPGPGVAHVPESWSPKTDVLLFSVAKGSEFSLWTYSLRDRKAAPWGCRNVKDASAVCDVTSSTPTGATFSPDGKWVAYTSTQRAMTTIYVQPFPPTGAVYPLSPKGSDSPKHVRWSADGRELFYDPRPSGFESVRVTTQPAFAFGITAPLPRVFAMSPPGGRTPYDVMPNGTIAGLVTWGQKEYVRGSLDQVQVVLNWTDWLKQRFSTR